jgi:archaemetzincin
LNRQGISLVSIGRFEKDFLERLANDLKIIFATDVSFALSYQDIMPYFDPTRKQYDANKLLQLIHKNYSDNAVKTIGLLQVDLFIPILTYIFGQAIYNGDSGIVSDYRLKNELYGLKGKEKLIYERFKKVTIHELGHTFGLIHCHIPDCVMRPGTYVEDIDQKKAHFCHKCEAELEKAIK